jgi:2,3-bisphosphoglycerate-independent phosphoglycerate mutase
MARKCIMILLDGVGDRSYPELGHCTPLQAAATPCLDQIAREGASGLYHAAVVGQALPSENAHFAMFGYDMEAFPGRGALEALGAGIALDAARVAVLAHFVTVDCLPDGTLVLKDGKPRASAEEIQDLVSAVGGFSAAGVDVRLHPTHGFRGILTLSGPVSPYFTDSDPITNGQPLAAVRPWETHADDPAAQNAARALGSYLEWVYRTARSHPVNAARRKTGRPLLNGLVTQRAGRLKQVTPFLEAWGLRGLSMASGIVYHGLAAYLGMDVRKVEDTPRPGDDLARRLKTAMSLLADYDFIHVHTKAPDEAAHTKDPTAKCRVIEALDRGIGAVLDDLMAEPELLIVVAADHSTPSSGPLVHSGEPVPLIFHGPGIRRDTVERYDEVCAANGALGFVRGREIMYLIVNHLDRARLQGIMDTPAARPFWPGRYEPLRVTEGKE